MADIFLSYSSEDRTRVALLAKALAGAGFSLWWDRDIRPGTDFHNAIESEIRAAKAVVVIWTEHSARSEWVRDEASFARTEGKLIPLRFGEAEPPLGFRQTQAIDFRKWHSDPRSPAFLSLRAALDDLLDRSAGAATDGAKRPVAERRRSFILRPRVLLPGMVALFAIVAAMGAWLISPLGSGAQTLALGAVEIRPFTARPDHPERAARATIYTEAFRQRLTELGVANESPVPDAKGRRPELALTGELAAADGKEMLTVRFDERASGATLWSVRDETSEGAAYQVELASFAMHCALARRATGRGTQLLGHFLRGCAQYFTGDFASWVTTAKTAYDLAPGDPNTIAFLAVASAGHGWGDSNSEAERQRLMQEAKRFAEEALRLDPENADALFAMGFTYDDFQFEKQEEWWQRSVMSNLPGWGTGRYANLLFAVGRVRESLDMEIRALQDRRSVSGGARAARRFFAEGNDSEAERIYELVRPLGPRDVGFHEVVTQVLYGKPETAQRMLEESQESLGFSDSEARCLERVLAARRGEIVEAAELAGGCGGLAGYALLALAGHLDEAFAGAERHLEANRAFGRFPPNLFGPEFREFRRDPRFWPLAAKMGLVDYWVDSGQWPDFCSEPDLPFDCRQRAEAERASTIGLAE